MGEPDIFLVYTAFCFQIFSSKMKKIQLAFFIKGFHESWNNLKDPESKNLSVSIERLGVVY